MIVDVKELPSLNPEFADIFNVQYGCLEHDKNGRPYYPIYNSLGKRVGKSFAIESIKAVP